MKPMPTIDELQPDVLESCSYKGILADGRPLELTATLLDLHGDAPPLAAEVRHRRVQASGALLFQTSSRLCPELGVVWQRFDSGVEFTLDDSEEHFLDDEDFVHFCARIVASFLNTLAEKDAKYARLAPPRLH